MNLKGKSILVGITGCAIGVATSCTAILDFSPIPSQCWCGEQWRAQISGASAYDTSDFATEIPASMTSVTRCVSMLEHLALDAGDPQDPVFMALRDAFRSDAIANCEIEGAVIGEPGFDHTDCATDTVSFNLVHLGACWESENLEADPPQTCPLESQCGQFYDCSSEPIILYNGHIVGETDGELPGDELLWSCDGSPRTGVGCSRRHPMVIASRPIHYPRSAH